MEYSVDAPEFAGCRVTVETVGVFGSPRLLVDGLAAEQQNGGVYTVPGLDGTPVSVRLTGSGLDAVPVAEINGRAVRLAAPLAWYEYVWCCLPLILLLLLLRGGAAGGILGAGASYMNVYVFRARKDAGTRYGMSGAVTFAVVIAYLGVLALLRLLILHGGGGSAR